MQGTCPSMPRFDGPFPVAMLSSPFTLILFVVDLSFASWEPASTQQPLQTITNSTATNAQLPLLTSSPTLERRQDGSYPTICGYSKGIQQSARSAELGWACTTDMVRGLWGFCQTSVYSAGQCSLGGNCVDQFACTTGCGRVSDTFVGTFTW